MDFPVRGHEDLPNQIKGVSKRVIFGYDLLDGVMKSHDNKLLVPKNECKGTNISAENKENVNVSSTLTENSAEVPSGIGNM